MAVISGSGPPIASGRMVGVPSTLPEGDPVPIDGSLPDQAYQGSADRSLSIYLHVPFCATRCGYCDFNTYTAGELGTSASPDSWFAAASAEIDLAAGVIRAHGDRRPVSTVFVGGGTPSLMGAERLGALLARIDDRLGLAPDAEVTTEANPESTDRQLLDGLLAAGYTRLSLGMQSTDPGVLRVLERTHTPGRPLEVVGWARAAGFRHVNLDLIYGTPGETDEQFTASVGAAIGAGVDHVSAYSLIVEPGTRMARAVRTGRLPMPAEDVLADRYLIADRLLAASGLHWYEVSNWAADEQARCRHNLAYWRGDDWWGIGPGAHSHLGGVRWWNVKHPHAYATALAEGRSPGQAREVLGEEARRTEDILLRLRLAEGLPLDRLGPAGIREAAAAAAEGLLQAGPLADGLAVLTLRGRLLADGLAVRLLD